MTEIPAHLMARANAARRNNADMNGTPPPQPLAEWTTRYEVQDKNESVLIHTDNPNEALDVFRRQLIGGDDPRCFRVETRRTALGLGLVEGT